MPRSKQCITCGTEYDDGGTGGMCPKCLLRKAQTMDPAVASQRAHFGNSEKNVPPKPQVIDQLFPELEILDVIGHGGMGVVYKARQKNLGREVAVKLLSTSLMEDPTFAERFTREARAMAMMNHPNIISIYDFGQRGAYYYLVMEFVDGLNLRQLVSSTKLEASESMELVPQLCDALQYAHDRGIVHRDIKPENVLVSQDGQVKIADFGLAKLTGNTDGVTLTQTRQVMGTVNYMAPEQMERPTEVDHRADIYSLGVVIYELLTGELPIGKFSPPSQKAKLDGRLDHVVMRALEKEPDLRYQQASEFKTGVQTVAQPGFMGRPITEEESIALKIGKMAFVTTATAVCIMGVFCLIMGDEDFGILQEQTSKIVGFAFIFFGGLLWAMFGFYYWIFAAPDPEEEKKPKLEDKIFEDQPKPAAPISVLVVRGFAMFSFFACAMFFVLSSGSMDISENIISRDSAKFLGIASAIFGGFLMVISGLVAQAKGYEEDDE